MASTSSTSSTSSRAVVHVPRGHSFDFRVTLDAAGVLGRMLDHPQVFAVGIPDPRRGPTRNVPVAETGRSREFDTNAHHDSGPRFNLTRVDPRTYRLAVLYGTRTSRTSRERVATVHVVPEAGGSLVQATLRRFSGPADAASALGRGMLSGVLVMGAVFFDPGTVIGGLAWWTWEGIGRGLRRATGRAKPTPQVDLPPTSREALVGLLGELFTPVARPGEPAPPTPFRE